MLVWESTGVYAGDGAVLVCDRVHACGGASCLQQLQQLVWRLEVSTLLIAQHM